MAAVELEKPDGRTHWSSADGIPAGAKRRTGSPRQVFATCTAAAVILALFSSADMASWSERADNQPFGEAAREIVNLWSEDVARLGLILPHQALRRTVRRLIELQWW
jgi:hypothetical protein